MNDIAAKNFAQEWNGRGNEESDYQNFWRDLLHDVFGVEKTTGFIEFQKPVAGKHIDAFIASTKILIEQKSFGEDLDRKYRQSDGEYLTPFEQAKRYADNLSASERPRKIITCNFGEFRIYDLQQMDSLIYLSGEKIYEPTVLKLENFRNDLTRLKFIADPNAEVKPEVKISKDAAKIVRQICKAIDKNYFNRDDAYIDALSKLCARLVFCFYADDEKIFTKIKFAEYLATLKNFSPEKLRDALQKFFDTLNTHENERPADLDDILKKFPHVDGGLFDEKIPIPPLNKNFQHEVEYAHIFRSNTGKFRLDEFGKFLTFSWREISPPIFGAMFEALFNPDTRRSDGIHYTTAENIHKVIDPLFLDDLREEFNSIRRKHEDKEIRVHKKIRLLKDFQDKLASLNFLDPACGSGNFLTETYLSLRRLENEVIKELCDLYADLPANPIKVTPRQFYGIEINDFAVAVAKDALWIAEIQMLRKTSWIIKRDLDELPLRKYISIHKANANLIDWRAVAPNVDYIIGNPPFVGFTYQNKNQKAELQKIFPNVKNLDYVCCWFKKASDFIQGTKIRCGFVATNSIVQGETVSRLWKFLKVHIDFAHRTFKWESDSDNPAHVHCVVVGFSAAENPKPKKIFDGKKFFVAENINAYLVDGEDIFVESRNTPIQDGVPKMIYGNKPADGGNLIVEANELDYFLNAEPAAKKFIRPLLGAEEFINGKKRFCLWLKDFPLAEIKKFPLIAERVEAVKNFRLQSIAAGIRKFAKTPEIFAQVTQPEGKNFILVPRVSSEKRKYIPIGYVNGKVKVTDAVQIVPDAELYHFGILTSSIHMAWTKTFCGRLKSDYRYSKDVVYNNFPWPTVDAEQKELITETAQKILDAREKFSSFTFAQLYDEATMPQTLRHAHKSNDYAVALAYGFENFLDDEPAIVAELMKLYKALTKA